MTTAMVPASARRGRTRLIHALVVSTSLLGATRGWSSGQGKSGGSESGNSSQGSNGSSNNSNDSSKNSNDSSKSSGDSTQNSPKNSSDSSSQGTTNQSTNSRGAHTFWAGCAVVVVGASVVGSVLATKGSHARRQQNTVALATFLRQNHGLLTHDVALAGGPVLDTWAYQLGLSATEKQRLAMALEGSPEQGALMTALDGPIDAQRAQNFSAAFFRVAARALGPARMQGLLARAAVTLHGDG